MLFIGSALDLCHKTAASGSFSVCVRTRIIQPERTRVSTGMRQSETPHQTDPRLDHDRVCAAIGWITVSRCLEQIRREASPQGDESRQAHIASGAPHQSRLPVPSGSGWTAIAAIERNGACARRDIGNHSMAHRRELMRPENVAFIAPHGPGQPALVLGSRESSLSEYRKRGSHRNSGPGSLSDTRQIFPYPVPFVCQFFLKLSKLNWPGEGLVIEASDVSRKRLIAAVSFAVVVGLAIDNILAEGVDRNARDGPQQEQRLGDTQWSP